MSIATFLVLVIMISIVLAMSSLVFYTQKISTNSIKSAQSYYAAEGGVEDALMRLRNNPFISPLSYNLSVGNSNVAISIPSIIGGSRVIETEGDEQGRIKKVQAVYSIDADAVSFHYGAQVGEGGLQMNNGSRIRGNVFSNGNIQGNGTIDNDVIVSGNGHSIDDVTIGGNAMAYSCLSPATIEGNLTYITGGTKTCTVQGTTSTQSAEITPQPFPISSSQIQEWKDEAAAGGTTTSDVTLTNGATLVLGPRKITGNLTVSNNAALTLTGTVHVLGTINVSNNGVIRLDNGYGSTSGIIISDSIITVSNNGILQGSGQSSSYLLVVSTSTADPAIPVSNNAVGAIFFAPNGGITISNNVDAKEITAYKLNMSNNAEIIYESGLASLFFTSGPGGGWKVTSWEEK